MSTLLAAIVGDADTPVSSTPGLRQVWVSPGAGSDSSTTPWLPDTPYATITKAVTSGYRVIHVDAGTHNVSSINQPVTLLMYPGTHTFSNAPVTSTVPFNMIGVSGRSPNFRYVSTGAAYISGSGTDLFQISNGSTDLYGGSFVGLRFNGGNITRSVIYASNVSGMRVEDCAMTNNTELGNTSKWRKRWLVYATGTVGHEISDWTYQYNSVLRYQHYMLVGPATFHDWTVQSNTWFGYRFDNVTEPAFYATAACYGFTQSADSGEFGAGGTDVEFCDAEGYVGYDSIVQQSRMGAFGEAFFHNTGNCRLRIDDARSSYITFGRGGTTNGSGDGEVKINGTYYKGAYDTSNNLPLNHTRIVVQDRGLF